MEKHLSLATFGGGCFWCTEAIFQRLKGVESVTPGYSGGTVENPTYDQVSAGNTGHAEVIQVEFDESVLSYKDLLYVFFALHDPTTVDRQGADVGTQYRSVVFYHTMEQKAVAEALIQELNESGKYKKLIATQVVMLDKFYKAEGYHKDYFNSNKNAPYCMVVIDPKIEKLYREFGDKVKEDSK